LAILEQTCSKRRPLISVAMSVFNGADFLAEAVESILSQSFRDFEFVIVDDGSSDETAEILEGYQRKDRRIRVWRQGNKGLIASLNRACALAQGKFVARMDADDIALSDRLERQVAFMQEHPDIAVVGGAIELIDSAGKSFGFEYPPQTDQEIKRALLRGDCPFSHPTVMMRAEVVASLSGYRPIVLDAEDFDLWSRIADGHKLANLTVPVLKYRRHPKQISIQKFKQQALSVLAARTAAATRRRGLPDPLGDLTEITASTLAGLGVSEAAQQSALCRAYVTCLRSMYLAGEYVAALNTARAAGANDFELADRAAVTDLRLLFALLLWRERKYARSIRTAGAALLRRPITLVRPLKPLLRRAGLVGIREVIATAP